MKNALTKKWPLLLSLALIMGMALRLIFNSDMEYKEDEEYMFLRLQNVGVSEPLPWLGIPSGVYIRNPGMSVWVFLTLGKLVGATTPLELNRAVELLNISALLLLIPFIFYLVNRKEREPWFWAIALAAVNPFAILYHRKIWAQSVLPFFSVLFLMSWWKRRCFWGALCWGLIGASIGQIHMSGFFFALGFVAWTFLFDRRNVNWRGWLTGSTLGSLTLIPWLIHVLTQPTGQPTIFGWGEAIQLKFWVFWITDPLGLHLGNPLGVLRGNSIVQQLADFARYPILAGHPTYLVGALHLLTALWAILILPPALIKLWQVRSQWRALLSGTQSETALALSATFFGYGLVITLATVAIHRYYMIITFPLEWVWLARMTQLAHPARARSWLGALFVLELLISASFIGYVHVNDGAPMGDYGAAYRAQGR
jgi:hypothetical protein